YLVEAEEQMIRTDAEVQLDRERNGEIKIYTDPLLANSRRRCSTFVKDLRRKGLVGFTREPKEFAGVFFAWKKERASTRMVLDCRRSNQRFVTPPGVELLPTEGLGRIECDAEQTSTSPIFLGKADVKDCFHRMMFGNDLPKYFCYPGGMAKEFGIVGQLVDGVPARADDYLWPRALALPMEWTWSLYFAQVANLGMVERAPAIASSQVATDRGPPIALAPSSSWHYVYVDNVGLIALDAADYVKGALADTTKAFDTAGLIMHDISVDCETAEALGVTLDGQKHQTLVTHRRYWKTLSVWHTVYTCIRERYWAKSDVWDSARQEVECFFGLMPLLRSEWDRPWLAQVLSVDASPRGRGVASSEFGVSTAKRISPAWWLADTDPRASCLSLQIDLDPKAYRLKRPRPGIQPALPHVSYLTTALKRTLTLVAPHLTLAKEKCRRPAESESESDFVSACSNFGIHDEANPQPARQRVRTWHADRLARKYTQPAETLPLQSSEPEETAVSVRTQHQYIMEFKGFMGIGLEVARRGLLAMAPAVMIGASCYLRPPEPLNLASENLVATAAPASQYWSPFSHPLEGGERKTTGDAHDSLTNDSPHMLPWVDESFLALKEKGACPKATSRPRLAKDGTYMADLFSGAGKVARAVVRLGISAKAWDIIHGANHDLTDPTVIRLLLPDIRDGKISAAMIALPCASLTIARDRTFQIRSRSEPRGTDLTN
ncbi:unnamed protein product, partial [Prorocentrum cordatum]